MSPTGWQRQRSCPPKPDRTTQTEPVVTATEVRTVPYVIYNHTPTAVTICHAGRFKSRLKSTKVCEPPPLSKAHQTIIKMLLKPQIINSFCVINWDAETVNPAFKGTEGSCTSVYQNIQRRELVDAENRVRDADCRGWTINPPMNGKATQLQPAETLISSRVHIFI